MKNLLFAFIASLFILPQASAQNNFVAKLQSGNYRFNEQTQLVQKNSFKGKSLYIVGFSDLPTEVEKEKIQRAGCDIIAYLPEKCFLLNVPNSLNIKKLSSKIGGAVPYTGKMKQSKIVTTREFPQYAISDNAQIRLMVKPVPGITLPNALAELNKNSFSEVRIHSKLKTLEVTVKESQIDLLSDLPFILLVQQGEAPAEHDNYGARTSHRSNYINTDSPNGLHYDGEGVVVALGDDGPIGPHIDYSGRLIQDYSTVNLGDHGDHVSGTIFGAGNKNPEGRGMAPGAEMVYYDYPDNLYSSTSHYNLHNIRITSSSYSNGCNAGYTFFSRLIDSSTYSKPAMIHVFSAGNSNGSNCGYGAGSQWGNITGGHKIGKNAMTVANLDHQDGINFSSSRGPSADGRIKPDISAVGTSVFSTIDPNDYGYKTGTSMSCPGVSGTLAQLFHGYKATHGNADPNAGLIKGIVLNTAEDLGNPGPDFIYGYGRINAKRALEVIEGNFFVEGNVVNGEIDTVNITVPANINNLRVMVYWVDPASFSAAGKVLVNDINSSLLTPSNSTLLPWVLDPTPNIANLSAPAVRAVDSLNNMEQITLENPTPGNYKVIVNGSTIPSASQTYFVTYYFEEQGPKLTYPIGGEGFTPGTIETIRWDAPANNSQTFSVEYSTDNGSTWNTINSTVTAGSRLINWLIPNNLTSEALVRISDGTTTSVSNNVFTIMGVPTNLNYISSCPDSIEVSWDSVPGAIGYEVLALGVKYMDSVGFTTNTTYKISGFNPNNDFWFTVKAIAPGGGKSQRAIAVQKQPGTFNCQIPVDLEFTYFASPIDGENPNCIYPNGMNVQMMVTNRGTSTVNSFDAYYDNGNTTSQTFTVNLAPGSSTIVSFSGSVGGTPGFNYNLLGWIDFPGDGNPYNDTLEINYSNYNSTLGSLQENFDNYSSCNTSIGCDIDCFLSSMFKNVENGVYDDADFRVNQGSTPSAGTGPNGDHTTGSGKYLYIESSGSCNFAEAVLQSRCVQVVAGDHLSFSYHMYGFDMGELHLDLLTENGLIEDIIPVISGNQGNNWITEDIDLSAYAGGVVSIRFRGITGTDYQSDIAIDDINIYNSIGVSENNNQKQVTVFPNPSNGEFTIQSEESNAIVNMELFDVSGKLLDHFEGSETELKRNYSFLPKGNYFLKITTEQNYETHKIIIQ